MKKILIIEDDQLLATIYRAKLATPEFRVEIVADGEAGLEWMEVLKPDVVILDLMLPKMSGLEVLKSIRAQPAFERLPVIVFSNTFLSNMVQEAWKAGATKCLSKANCTPKQVLEVIRGIFAPPAVSLPPAPPASVASPAAAPGADAEFEAELRASFVTGLPATLAGLRSVLQTLIKSIDEAGKIAQLRELYRKVHALTGNAGIAGLADIAQMADALEALLKEMYERPRNINPSTIRTIAMAVDFLGVLFDRGAFLEPHAPGSQAPPSVLVVDDEAISRRAVVYSLEKARLQSVNLDNPVAALERLTSQSFDLVILDIDMPGMTGLELCTKLRTMPAHKRTAVIFVTSMNNFESRANSTMSGGNDLIAKPFLFMELAVKSLVYVLRNRLTPFP